MALIVVHDELRGNPVLRESVVDLPRLAERHARVVRAVDDEERRADAVGMRERRDLVQELAVALERAVLTLAERAAPLGGVLEEGDEARDPDHVDRRRPALGMEGER